MRGAHPVTSYISVPGPDPTGVYKGGPLSGGSRRISRPARGARCRSLTGPLSGPRCRARCRGSGPLSAPLGRSLAVSRRGRGGALRAGVLTRDRWGRAVRALLASKIYGIFRQSIGFSRRGDLLRTPSAARSERVGSASVRENWSPEESRVQSVSDETWAQPEPDGATQPE